MENIVKNYNFCIRLSYMRKGLNIEYFDSLCPFTKTQPPQKRRLCK